MYHLSEFPYLTLRKIDGEEARTRPGYDKRGKLHDRECEELPWNPEIEEYALQGVGTGRVETPLTSAW
jgi:hypothetical protein